MKQRKIYINNNGTTSESKPQRSSANSKENWVACLSPTEFETELLINDEYEDDDIYLALERCSKIQILDTTPVFEEATNAYYGEFATYFAESIAKLKQANPYKASRDHHENIEAIIAEHLVKNSY